MQSNPDYKRQEIAPAFIEWQGVVAIAIALIVAWPLIGHTGLLNTRGGGDSPFLLQRLHQLSVALLDGHFPVRWMPDANYGYGYPFFNYYAPFSIYVAAFFRLLGLSYVRSIQCAQLSAFFVAAWAMYALTRHLWENRWSAVLASVAYTTAPFHLVNVYVRGDSLAEFWAMAFYPLILLALFCLAEQPRWQRAILLGGSYAALILSHNISALIFSPFLGMTGVALLWLRPNRIKFLSYATLGVVLGLLLSSWFWLPAIVEKGLAQLDPVTQGYFHYNQHFRSWSQLIQSSWKFNYDVSDGGAFRVGLVQIILTLGGMLCPWPVRLNRWVRFLVILILLVATMMIMPFSAELWSHLPLLEFTQFPWRFLSVQAVATSLLIGAWGNLSRFGRISVTLLIFVLLLSAMAGLLKLDYLPIQDGDVSAEKLAQYEWFSGNIGTTISAEYLPQTVQPRPVTSAWVSSRNRDHWQLLEGSADATMILRQTASQRWEVDVHSPAAKIVVPTLYWKGWRVYGESGEISAEPAHGSGLIQFDLPQGKQTITLELTRPPIRWVAELVSAVALILTFATIGTISKRQWGHFAIVLTMIAMIAGIGRWWPTTQINSTVYTWDFDQMAYLHPEPEGVSWTNGAKLIGVTNVQTLVYGDGDWQTFTLYWDKPTGMGHLSLVTPAFFRATEKQPVPIFMEQRQPLANTTTYTFSADLPDGLYIPRLTIENEHPLTPNGQMRGDIYLPPIYISGPKPNLSPSPHSLDLQLLEIKPQEEDQLDLKLAWWTKEPLTANYRATLRLDDSRGYFYAKHDAQPGYGFRPSSSWPVESWNSDWVRLRWLAKDGVPPYRLIGTLYDAETGKTVLVKRLGTLDGVLQWSQFEPNFELPETGVNSADATWGEQIRLRGYRSAQGADQLLKVTLYWEGLGKISADYTHFVHLVNEKGEVACPTCQHDGQPQLNSYPTTQWAKGEIVDDSAVISLVGVPAGTYHLLVGWYDSAEPNLPRLPAHDAQGQPLPNQAFTLPVAITISGASLGGADLATPQAK